MARARLFHYTIRRKFPQIYRIQFHEILTLRKQAVKLQHGIRRVSVLNTLAAPIAFITKHIAGPVTVCTFLIATPLAHSANFVAGPIAIGADHKFIKLVLQIFVVLSYFSKAV